MSFLYDNARQEFLKGNIDWDTGVQDFRVVLVNVSGSGTLYTANQATDTALDDIPAGARIATSGTLTTNVSLGAGVADAADLTGGTTLAGVGGSDDVEALVIFRYNATESLALLIAYVDNAAVAVVPNTGDIDVVWHASGIFKL